MIYFTEPVKNLMPDRQDVSVKLCKPQGQPEKWTTRAGEFTQHFDLQVDPENIENYQLVSAS